MSASVSEDSAQATQTAVVVIPVYTAALSENEFAALEQLCHVLRGFPRVIIAPESLAIDELAARYGLSVERFPDRCFRSVLDYNRLMLSIEFYQRFLAYRYILIHQLDAFVFRDELAYWCSQGFDYIGAPWMARWALLSPWQYPLKAPRGWLARRLAGVSERWLRYANVNQVGNGGFSLRRVQAFLDVLRNPPESLETYRDPVLSYYQEDAFWGVGVNRWRSRIRTPDWRTALRFAVEVWPRETCDFMDGRLPFGCHAWAKCDPDFWLPRIRQARANTPERTAC